MMAKMFIAKQSSLQEGRIIKMFGQNIWSPFNFHNVLTAGQLEKVISHTMHVNINTKCVPQNYITEPEITVRHQTFSNHFQQM